MSALLDYERARPQRLRELLALPDERLIAALAGSRKQSLRARHRAFRPKPTKDPVEIDRLCRHRDLYPTALKRRFPSATLHIGGSLGQLGLLTQRPLVAIVGSRRPSDYGARMARSLARGLAASGITVVGDLQPGIAESAHRGALELQVGTLAVTGDGLELARGARRVLYDDLVSIGCVLTELQSSVSGRGWGSTACADMLLALASVLVVIEAEETSREMSIARHAMEQGTLVAATPGRVESPLAAGPHALLLDGASLLRGPRDVLDLLYEGDAPVAAEILPAGLASLPAHLRAVLERILNGDDKPQSVLAGSASALDALAALSELELAGFIVRTAGGRYVPASGPTAPSLHAAPRDT